jgi:hypothetical protein
MIINRVKKLSPSFDYTKVTRQIETQIEEAEFRECPNNKKLIKQVEKLVQSMTQEELLL